VASSSTGTVTGETAPAGSYLVEINYSGQAPFDCTVDLGDGSTTAPIVNSGVAAGTPLTVGATPGTLGAFPLAVSNELKYGVTYAVASNVSLSCGGGSSSSIVMTAVDALN
jgi:hypothetical protein